MTILTTPQLRREFDRLMPSLKDLREQEIQLNKITGGGGLGLTQAFELGQRCNAEYVHATLIAHTAFNLTPKFYLSAAVRALTVSPMTSRSSPQSSMLRWRARLS